MAQSRRRERELARRRFERRRLAEMQRREFRRRRNTTIGAVAGVIAVLGVVIGLGFALLGGGSSTGKTTPAGLPGSSSTPAATSSSPAASGAVTSCAKISPDPVAKGEPAVPYVAKPPKKLEINDVKTGTGATAKSGDTVTVKYVGVNCSNGKSFDASYTDGAKHQEFSFKLGAGQVIPGWDQGVAGMKVGGVRQLVIPPALAYGSAGQGSVPPNETLNFVITLDKVSS